MTKKKTWMGTTPNKLDDTNFVKRATNSYEKKVEIFPSIEMNKKSLKSVSEDSDQYSESCGKNIEILKPTQTSKV